MLTIKKAACIIKHKLTNCESAYTKVESLSMSKKAPSVGCFFGVGVVGFGVGE